MSDNTLQLIIAYQLTRIADVLENRTKKVRSAALDETEIDYLEEFLRADLLVTLRDYKENRKAEIDPTSLLVKLMQHDK